MTSTTIFCRISTPKQLEGLSLEAQETRLREYAAEHQMQVRCVVACVESGKVENPSYMLLNTPHLIVFDISRFSRNYDVGVDNMSKLLHNDHMIHFINNNLVISKSDMRNDTLAYHRFLDNLMLAQNESEMISQRVKNVIRHKRKNQEYTGGRVPYGLKLYTLKCKNGRLIKKYKTNDHEINVLTFINVCRSPPYSGEDLTLLMRRISRYDDPLELVNPDTERGREQNTEPLDFSTIASLLNEYEVTYRGKKFTSAIVSRNCTGTDHLYEKYLGEIDQLADVMSQCNIGTIDPAVAKRQRTE
jgi:DNA invertase Pin-like site-specific DNA recombinase